jgi:hypothetical protein
LIILDIIVLHNIETKCTLTPIPDSDSPQGLEKTSNRKKYVNLWDKPFSLHDPFEKLMPETF